MAGIELPHVCIVLTVFLVFAIMYLKEMPGESTFRACADHGGGPVLALLEHEVQCTMVYRIGTIYQ